jgi:hypothetical protein
MDAESQRMAEDARRERNWKRWGPYLAEREWGTVREDYSACGACWDYFPHDHARSRAYRWTEDGLLGISDRQGRLCFALALWNGRDSILKERLFGLNHDEGNHGEDVKECYFYLDSTPTHSHMKALYKYPQAPFPYAELVAENRRRGVDDPEFELTDTGIFDSGRYFDVTAEYAKGSPNDILIRVTVANRGPEDADIHVLPTLWFRNTWCWGSEFEGRWPKPEIRLLGDGSVLAEHVTLGRFRLAAEPPAGAEPVRFLFTENDTNSERLYGRPNYYPYVKDAFHRWLIEGQHWVVNPANAGTKAAAVYHARVPAGGEVAFRLRLHAEEEAPDELFGPGFDDLFARRIAEADAFYASRTPDDAPDAERRVVRHAYAGLLWTKQFYHFVVRDWLDGDPNLEPPPASRREGRNRDWRHLYNREVLSVPDGWEYPWYAAWDLAFHMVPFARIDPHFAKEQLVLLLREWYLHPNGQMPAYEFAFSDVNPPVHAWAAWRVYQIAAEQGDRDRAFLARVFQKLLINFTWWVNRKDPEGRHLFSGGFLGLDNIGVFDRGKPVPGGGCLEQADGTAWMAFYSSTMLAMALELADEEPAYEDMASKFLEHFVTIADAINTQGGAGLWNEEDGFYYDRLTFRRRQIPVRLRSMVGLIPLFAVEVLDEERINRLPGFASRLRWFLEHRKDLARNVASAQREGAQDHGLRLLAVPPRERLERVLRYLLDERELLSPYGVRSLSRVYAEHPYVLKLDGGEYAVRYAPGESPTQRFGANSNWRGPVWFPLNWLLVEALRKHHRFYGENLRVECPTGSGRWVDLAGAADEIAARLRRIFSPDFSGRSPWQGADRRYAEDPHWRDLTLFHEFFHGDTGRGCGADHQTGWSALIAECFR